MASSRKSSFDLEGCVVDALSPLVHEGASVLLGLSGGVDSVVLLHVLQQLSIRSSWSLSALHVHHGISPEADAWATFCANLCASHDVPLRVERVDITPLRSLGTEAAARKLRHAALSRQGADVVLLAHHLDDQAETVLLQLLRGSGVRGASAMPAVSVGASAQTLLRPFLDVPRSVLLEYAERHALEWVEDESNADDTYPRNFLRHRVLPSLEQRFPAYRKTLLRSAHNFYEAVQLLDELARQDSEGYIADRCLDVEALRDLDAARGKNVLRYFLAAQGAPIPESARLQEMRRQLCDARQDAQVCIDWRGWQVRRYRTHIHVMPALSPALQFEVAWSGEAEILLPASHGTLRFQEAIGQGISVKKLRSGVVTVCPPRTGELVQLDATRPHKKLNILMQEHGIPPWQRRLMPLLFCGGDLVCVPGVEVAGAYRAQQDEIGLMVTWTMPCAE